jgi:histone deacetylase 1/2
MVGENQLTVCLYVDDLFISCVDRRAIEDLIIKLKVKYESLSYNISNKLKYLGLLMDFSVEGEVKLSMPKMLDAVINECEVTSTAATPAGADLFNNKAEDRQLESEEREKFHSLVMKLQYLAKRTRPDILLPVVYLSSRVLKSTERDMRKLLRIVKYLRGTKELTLNLTPNEGFLELFAYVDASFAVHHDLRSHTGAVITFGAGGIFFKSTRQKLNTKSSTEAELVGIADALTTVIWARDFLIEQGYDMGPAVLYQDNMSTIAMVNNGSASNERTRHINIKFFFVHDRVKKGEIVIKYMNTDDMLADMFTKPMQGDKFKQMRDTLLNCKLT